MPDLKKLYDLLKKGGAEIGTEEHFAEVMNDEGTRRKVHNALVEDGISDTPFDEWQKGLGYGQQEPAQPPAPTSTQQQTATGDSVPQSSLDNFADSVRNTNPVDSVRNTNPVDSVRQDSTKNQSWQTVATPSSSPIYQEFAKGYAEATPGGKSAFDKARDVAALQDYGDLNDSEDFNAAVINRTFNEGAIPFLNTEARKLAIDMVKNMPDQSPDRIEDLRNAYYDAYSKIQDMQSRAGYGHYDIVMDNYIKPQLQDVIAKRWNLPENEARKIVNGLPSKFEDTYRIGDERKEYATVQQYLDPIVNKYIDDYEANIEMMMEARDMNSPMPTMSGMNAGAMELAKKGIKANYLDAEKVWQVLSKEEENILSDLLGNPEFMAYMKQQAEKKGYKSGNDYLFAVIRPNIMRRVEQKFMESETARKMPKNDLEDILSRFHNSVTGMLFDIAGKSQRERDVESRGREMTRMGMNPNVQPKWWKDIVGVVPEMAPDFWMWGGWGKLGGKAAAGLMRDQIAEYAAKKGVTETVAKRQLMELASRYMPERIKQNFLANMTQMGVMMGGAEGTTAAVEGVYKGEDAGTILYNTIEKGVTGARHGAELGGAIGAFSAATGSLRGVRKMLGKAAAYTGEAGVMYGQEMAGQVMSGQGLPDNSEGGFLSTMARLAAIKASGNLGHTARRAYDFLKAPKSGIKDWYANPSARGVLTDKDLRYLETGEGVEFIDAINGMRLPANEGEMDASAIKAAQAYGKFMDRKDVPLETKQHIAYLLDAPAPEYKATEAKVDGTTVRTYSMDGHLIEEKDFDFLSDAQEYADKDKGARDKNTTDEQARAINDIEGEQRFADHVNELYQSALQKTAAADAENERLGRQKKGRHNRKNKPAKKVEADLTEDEMMAVSLVERNTILNEAVRKMYAREELTEEEKKVVGDYAVARDKFVSSGRANELHQADYERVNGLEEGAVKRALEGHTEEEAENLPDAVEVGDGLYRTAEEQRIVEAYRQDVNGLIEKQRAVDNVAEAAGKAREEGYGIEEQEDLNDAKNALGIARERLGAIIGEEELERFESNPIASMQYIIENDAWGDDARQAGIAYVEARSRFDGVIDKARDDMEQQVQTVREQIESHVHQDGMIHPATLKGGDLNNPGRQVYVLSGDVKVREDGSIDVDNSSKAIFVVDPATGKPESVDINDIASVETIDTQQELAEAEQNVRQEASRAAADKIDGILPFNINDTYSIKDNAGGDHTVTILQDNGDGTVLVSYDGGEPMAASKEQLQQMADEKSMSLTKEKMGIVDKTPQVTEQKQEETTPPAETNTTPPVAEVKEGEGAPQQASPVETPKVKEAPQVKSGAEPMPMVGKGDDAEPDFLATTPKRGHDYLYSEAGIKPEAADKLVENQIAAADKELEKVKGKEPEMGLSVAKYKREMAEWQQKVDAAQKASDYWHGVRDERSNAVKEQQIAEVQEKLQEAEPQATEEPVAEVQPVEQPAPKRFDVEHPAMQERRALPKTKEDLFQQHIDEQDSVDELGGLVRNSVASSHLSTDWSGALHSLGRNIGRRIVLISGKDAEAKYGKGVRGFYDHDTNTIYMNADYYNNDERMRSFVAGHEISHALKTDNNPELWDAYVDAVRDAMGEEFDTKFGETRKLYDDHYNAYNEGKQEGEKLRLLTDEEVAEEVASDWAGEHILTDADAIKKVVDHAESVGADPVSLTGKILKWINDRISFLNGAKERGEDVDEELTAMERAKVLWQDMYDVATAKQNERVREARQRNATDNGEAVVGDPLKTFSLSNDNNERAHQERVLERNGIDPDEVESERDYAAAVAMDEVGVGGVKMDGGNTTRFSYSANTKAAGFDSYRVVNETRTTKDGREITEEKKIPHTDEEGNVILRMKDKDGNEKVFSVNNKVTADDIKGNKNSSWDMMLNDSVELGAITEEKADIIRQKLADVINLGLELGSAKNGGVKNLTNNWQWVGETVFKTVAKNGDAQYGTSIDITRVCKKNEQMIYAISERQRQQGYGITPGQILDLYRSIEEAGFQTPCPVCYVFSRYIRNGKYANGMINGMMKYGEHLPGGNDEWTAKQWAKELTRLDILKKASENSVNAAVKDIDTIPDLIDDLWLELNTGVTEERKAEIMKAIESLDDRYRRALDVYGQVSLTNWIKSFAIQSKNNKYVLRDDVRIPRTEEEWNDFKEHALDLRLTASVYANYPAIQRMRKSAGSAGGKEITFASDNRPGEVAIGIGRGNETEMVNYYDLAINGKTEAERKEARRTAKRELAKSIAIAAKQSLRGGQRMWSWSDNIERLSADVGTNLMQMDIVNGAVQSYSKQLEGINLVAKMNAYVNGSLMARGEGYAEVAPENTKVVDGVRVTTTDIKGMARKNGKMEERVFSEAGSPVYEEGGKYYTATFDDVVGIDPFSHDTEDGRHLQGLFELNGRLDKAGNIMVGMNDMHIKTILADPRVFFCIPWHSSGQSVHILQQMMNILGVDFKARNAVDYTSMQEEKMMDDGGVNDRLRNLWEKSRNESDWECGIEGGIESGDGENLSEGQKRYRFLRSQIFNGNVFREHPPKPKAPNRKKLTKAKYKEKLEEYNQKMQEWEALDKELPQIKKEILNDHFLKQVYDAVEKIPDKQMTNGDNQYIYPYEYWDETSTYETAYKNNARYLEYCRRLGRRPKFSGRWDTNDEAAMNTGNFMDSKGYWKLLIDRRMYKADGSYQGLDPVDSTGFDAHDADPRWTRENFLVTEVADNEATKDIVQKTVERERQLFGDNPSPNYEDFVLDYSEGEKRKNGKVSAIERHQESVAATDELYKAQLKAHEEKVKAQEEAKERRKQQEKEAQARLSVESKEEDNDPRFSLGVPYQGSKNRIAERIIERLPEGRRFIDLFSGGGAMTHAAMLSGKYGRYHMNDINDAGQQLFLQGARGEWDNYDRTEMTPEEFAAIKGTPEALPWSYNGLGRNLARPDKNGRNKAAEQIRRVQSLSSLRDQVGNVDATNMDYRGVILHPGDVVYADIPYEGTDQAGYGKGKFNKQAFVEWAQAQDVPIFVSEYTMPEGWVEVESYDVPGMKGGRRQEKLWVQEKFAESMVREDATEEEKSESQTRFSIVEDPATIERLEKEPTVTRYRAMVEIDGKLYPPMSVMVDGELREPTKEGVWERSDETPIEITEEQQAAMDALDAKEGSGYVDIIPGKLRYIKSSKTGKGTLKFKLNKDNGDDVWAAYNPYFHTSTSGMNDQFASAWKRPNLVVAEVSIPESELTDGYQAPYAKDAVGNTPWKSGTVNNALPEDRQRTVTLSRYAKVEGKVDDAKVAKMIAKQLEGLDIEVPFNVVTPSLRDELVKQGVKIGAPEKGNAGKAAIPAYEEWLKSQGDEAGGNGEQVRFALGDPSESFRERQKKAVEEKGVVMPGLNNAVLEVTKDIPRHPYTGNIQQATAQAIKAAKKKYVPNGNPKPLSYNKYGKQFEYTISGRAIGILLSAEHQGMSSDKGGHLALAEYIDKVISNSIEVEEHPDRIKTKGIRNNDRINPDALMHRFFGVARIEGTDYLVESLLQEDGREGRGNGIHSYVATEIKVLDEITPNTSNGVDTPNSELEGYPLANLIKDVRKTMEPDKKILSVSAELDEQDSNAEIQNNAGNPVSLSIGTDDQGLPYDNGDMPFDEMISKGLADLAQKNKDNVELRVRAMRGIGGNLAKLRQAMSLQRTYDRGTVDSIVRMANMMMGSGIYSGFTPYEVKRLMGMVNRAAGREDITKEADKVVDLMVNHQLKELDAMFKKQLKTKATKIDNNGVEVQAGLDIAGQRMMQALKDGMNLDKDAFNEYSASVQDRMFSDDEVTAKNAAEEWQGVQLAQQYNEEIKGSKDEEKTLRKDLREAEEAVKAGTMERQAYNEFVKETEAAIRENKLARTDAYLRMMEALGGNIGTSRQRAKEWQERELQRVNDIRHNANSDLEGVPTDEHSKPTAAMRRMNNVLLRGFLSPLPTFDYMLRLFGQKSVDGRGYLWNRFMTQYMHASDSEFNNVYDAHKKLDDKVSEVMGEDMKWSDLFSVEKDMPTVSVEFWDGGEKKSHELTQGNLLYIYMVNKMSDGRMKLRRMGITEEDVERIKGQIRPKFLKLGDWLQDTFLKEKRKDYNEVYERMFGAPMAAIEDYFPLKMNDRSRAENVDVNDESYLNDDRLGSTITGSVIKRTKNAMPLDLTNADAFDVVLEHIDNMEHWRSFAEMNRDLGELLSYKNFRNKVMNMGSYRYGSGKVLWNQFKKTAAIATSAYRPKVNSEGVDKAVTNLAKGVSAAKVSLRFYTALKQLTSYPAYFSEANAYQLAMSSHPYGMYTSWKWAMDELPGFKKRWLSRQAGDTRLMPTESDFDIWKRGWADRFSRIGMLPNAFVDAVTVAIGSKAVYETKLAKYKKEGWDDEKAKEHALRDAWVAYNETQQSSEAAFTSAVQLDRTVAANALTIFRNSPMGYQRRYTQALSNLKRKAKKGYKEESIEFMAKQMMRDGLDEEQAKKAATRAYNRSYWRDLADVTIFGYGLQFTWALAPIIPYLIWGDDDKKRKDLLEDAAMTAFTGGIEGLAGGNFIADQINGIRRGENSYGESMHFLPLLSDIETTLKNLKQDPVRGVNDLVNLAVQSGFGFNPQTVSDWVVAALDWYDGDYKLANEFGLFLMRFLSMPQKQIDEMYLDELGMNAREASKLDVAQLALRYAKYKANHDAPLTGWMRSEGSRLDAEGKYIDKFMEKYKERVKQGGDPDVNASIDEYKEGEYKKATNTKKRLDRLLNIGQDAYMQAKEEWKKTPEYLRYTIYEDYKSKIDDAMKAGDYAQMDKLKAELSNALDNPESLGPVKLYELSEYKQSDAEHKRLEAMKEDDPQAYAKAIEEWNNTTEGKRYNAYKEQKKLINKAVKAGNKAEADEARAKQRRYIEDPDKEAAAEMEEAVKAGGDPVVIRTIHTYKEGEHKMAARKKRMLDELLKSDTTAFNQAMQEWAGTQEYVRYRNYESYMARIRKKEKEGKYAEADADRAKLAKLLEESYKNEGKK